MLIIIGALTFAIGFSGRLCFLFLSVFGQKIHSCYDWQLSFTCPRVKTKTITLSTIRSIDGDRYFVTL